MSNWFDRMLLRMACMKASENKVSDEFGDIYHEKQAKELCALHALNNLFQDSKAFGKKEMDEICYSLSPGTMINPHKSMFGLGNYDVNVLMAAVQYKECEAIWFDKRKDVSCLCLKKVFGFILNIPTEYKWGIFTFPIHRKHWIAIRDIDGIYYNLDSKLEGAEVIGKSAELLSYLSEQLECQDKELLVIVSKDVEEKGTWRVVDQVVKSDGEIMNGDIEIPNSRILKLTINLTETADGKHEITGVKCDNLADIEKQKQTSLLTEPLLEAKTEHNDDSNKNQMSRCRKL